MEDVCQACGGNTLVQDLEAKPVNTVWSWFPAWPPCLRKAAGEGNVVVASQTHLWQLKPGDYLEV